ncbi:hypothetical protein [uncultured Chryseobacterium sp.]|uniref:hypothetical protein n=1 Tax=uncultured Chryseobacterium sp. TaxID=259322 RepID=UPI0025FF811F|nr:hypothetical protein [uncultured Chryseobacterium sp.]
MNNKPLHNFHIPVMGLAYTIDSPIRVAQYGISSVVSIIDDEIVEKMKNFYSKKFSLNYPRISTKTEDYRARRITEYLNMMEDIVQEKFEAFKEEISSNSTALKNFTDMLPNTSKLKEGLQQFLSCKSGISSSLKGFIDEYFVRGNIDVNIMTKVDKENFRDHKPLPVIYNDAHASLRGFANSKLSSSVVLSAGMNPRLYSYLEEFDDFFPDRDRILKKKIILKVSDFRSAMIQGNFLAKKGLWVSEYRVESGLNCGGHAFATEGLLLGPIMEEFKLRKTELIQSAHLLMVKALKEKGKHCIAEPLHLNITVQGGVGTAEEHDFLIKQYAVESVGWGSPFLLVPEATCVDDETRKLLAVSEENDFYLSHLSPLGVPFNTVKGTSNELIRREKYKKSRFGSSCPKKLLALNREYSEEGICTASKKYQDIQFAELDKEKEEISPELFEKKRDFIIEKACLCVGLVNSAYLENNLEIKGEKQGVVICPGPNLAYFNKEVSLFEMVRHIYGNGNILGVTDRPHMFINELKMYIDHLKKEMADFSGALTNSQIKKWMTFKENLLKGIEYYQELFLKTEFFTSDLNIMRQLSDNRLILSEIEIPEKV